MDINKICRCCLSLGCPLLSIYDCGSGNCVADMLMQIADVKPQPYDNLPGKACLQCISEINRCYMFKLKCEISNRTLQHLQQDAKTAATVKKTVICNFQLPSISSETDRQSLNDDTAQTNNCENPKCQNPWDF